MPPPLCRAQGEGDHPYGCPVRGLRSDRHRRPSACFRKIAKRRTRSASTNPTTSRNVDEVAECQKLFRRAPMAADWTSTYLTRTHGSGIPKEARAKTAATRKTNRDRTTKATTAATATHPRTGSSRLARSWCRQSISAAVANSEGHAQESPAHATAKASRQWDHAFHVSPAGSNDRPPLALASRSRKGSRPLGTPCHYAATVPCVGGFSSKACSCLPRVGAGRMSLSRQRRREGSSWRRWGVAFRGGSHGGDFSALGSGHALWHRPRGLGGCSAAIRL